MKVPSTSPDITSSDPLGSRRQQAASVIGDDAAKRLRAIPQSGLLYIDAPLGRAFLSWLIDLFVVVGAALGLGLAVLGSSSSPNPVPGAAVIMIILLLVLPFLYGWCYRNGRALGGLLTGTRLVRAKDGERIGWGKAGWAMLIRVFFPLFFIVGFLDSGHNDSFSTVRTSIDDRATRKIRAAGIVRQ